MPVIFDLRVITPIAKTITMISCGSKQIITLVTIALHILPRVVDPVNVTRRQDLCLVDILISSKRGR